MQLDKYNAKYLKHDTTLILKKYRLDTLGI